jgi:hypothetical protein
MKTVILFVSMMVSAGTAATTVLNQDLLKGTPFYLKEIIYESEIRFTADGGYVAEYSSEGWDWLDSGKYEIKGSKVILSPSDTNGKKYQTKADSKNSLGEGSCYLENPADDLFYGSYLVCESKYNSDFLLGQNIKGNKLKFPVRTTLLINVKRRYQNQNIVTLGLADAEALQNVKIRRSPSVSGEAVKYFPEIYGDYLEYVPKGTKLTLIARTENKITVEKWNNYWYLVNAGAVMNVWVYGEFVKAD